MPVGKNSLVSSWVAGVAGTGTSRERSERMRLVVMDDQGNILEEVRLHDVPIGKLRKAITGMLCDAGLTPCDNCGSWYGEGSLSECVLPDGEDGNLVPYRFCGRCLPGIRAQEGERLQVIR